MSHISGAVVGLLLGIVVLRNLRVLTWERVIWWFSLLLFLGLFLAAIVWNAGIVFADSGFGGILFHFIFLCWRFLAFDVKFLVAIL